MASGEIQVVPTPEYVVIEKANANYVNGNCPITRYGKVVQIMVNGLVDLPNEDSVLFTVPESCRPSGAFSRSFDQLVPTNTYTPTTFANMRFTIYRNGDFHVYNYFGSVFSNTNCNLLLTFVLS